MTLLIAVITAALCLFPGHSGLVHTYDKHFFYFFQTFRGILFSFLPFSLGDVIYIVAGGWLLLTVCKWVAYIVRFRAKKHLLTSSVLRTVNTILAGYLFFFFGWGANYYKVPLHTYWGFDTARSDTGWKHDPALRRQYRTKDSLALVAFDSFLVVQINAYAPHYRKMSLSEINDRAKKYYSAYTDCHVAKYGLQIKPTFFGYFMERLAVEGYYNPFTGEGQVDKGLPGFTMPFLVSHEMAHQAGIAAEDDANLVAYALGTACADSTFRYSSYLNIWIYTSNRLYRRDSATANRLEQMLNKLTTAQLDTLDQLSKKYQNKFALYSSDLYDSYLKMQDQKEGIRSYGNVSSAAWLLEQQRMTHTHERIRIP
jgi:Protein of unknown function (DUF3810)